MIALFTITPSLFMAQIVPCFIYSSLPNPEGKGQ